MEGRQAAADAEGARAANQILDRAQMPRIGQMVLFGNETEDGDPGVVLRTKLDGIR